jgi:phage portal protein BeeE
MLKTFENIMKKGFTPVITGDNFSVATTKDPYTAITTNEWAYSAVTVRARAFAGANIKLMKKMQDDIEDVQIYTHKILDILNKPNRMQTTQELMQCVCMQYDIY